MFAYRKRLDKRRLSSEKDAEKLKASRIARASCLRLMETIFNEIKDVFEANKIVEGNLDHYGVKQAPRVPLRM